ncbi:HRDC domain-containing protein [Deinococcus hopiensis]|nr:HRDC domain-containing protein [Deinococcus hopiensis]
MTGNRIPSRSALRPDARMVTLHAERGDPHARLAEALADLEGADWGLTLAGEAALARQLAALLGSGVLRVDERLGVDRAALAEQGLAAAGLEADWTGARAVWLAEPDERTLRRAERAGVPVIVDGTLAPGGQWFTQGAAYVTYRSGVTLTGFAEPRLALLFGHGAAPAPAAPAPADITVALALRDVATLPLRLARAARTTGLLAERLGGRALPLGPTALLLPPDAAPDTPQLPGGVLAATRSVDGGVVLAPGLQDVDAALALLHGGRDDSTRPSSAPHAEEVEAAPALAPRQEETPLASPDPRPAPERAQFGRSGFQRSQPALPRTDVPSTDVPVPDAAESGALGRMTFEAPVPVDRAPQQREEPAEQTQVEERDPAAEEPASEETWTPEIVFSGDVPDAPAPLPMPVSAGPDAPELELTPPLASAPQPQETSGEEEAEDPAFDPQNAAQAPEPEDAQAGVAGPTPGPELAPDLPAASSGAPDPTADLTDEQAAVFARLREWRNAESKRQEVSRFIIASNATLAEIARRVPYTLEDLRAVRGMGPERLKKYGEKILEVVRG